MDRLQSAFHSLVPWEDWFEAPENVERALADAGLRRIEVTTRQYTVALTPGDYVTMKESGVEGMLIRQMFDETSWNDFGSRARDVFQQRFKSSLTFVRNVHLGVATK